MSFLIIGIVTVQYFTAQYNDYHRGRLIRKGRAVLTAIEYLFEDYNLELYSPSLKKYILKQKLSSSIKGLADIHAMDINVYDLHGDLIVASQPIIFEKGLMTKKIDPMAYHHLLQKTKTQFTHDEHIGNLTYLSSYLPVKNRGGETMAVLNLPYFAGQNDLREEISTFLVTLINVYVLLLVVAGIFAFLISNYITRTLRAISEKLKQVKIGKPNEPIQWTSDDEIGVLVKEYNKMISELEKSAALLAKSERESAWREMAKQVAHEIKNPLTPMKLSVQHLLRAHREDASNIKELTQRVARTLIGQIDTLSNIASEFSSFAQMPKSSNEKIAINKVLESVANLYCEHKKVSLTLSLPHEACFVFTDKDQLLRVFNNLIQNAIQAIHKEEKGEINIALNRKTKHVVVKVKDNGQGIAPEQREKVFMPNFTTSTSGMGLGLAMAKNIIESAGGKIWFESKVNVGTTFFVELPLMKS